MDVMVLLSINVKARFPFLKTRMNLHNKRKEAIPPVQRNSLSRWDYINY